MSDGKEKEKTIFQIPATLTKYSSMANRAMKFVFETQETIEAKDISILASFHENVGWLNFAVRKLEAMDLKDLPEIDFSKYDRAKSPSQLLRNVIYRYWEQKGKQGNFDLYYLKAMTDITNQYKEKLT